MTNDDGKDAMTIFIDAMLLLDSDDKEK